MASPESINEVVSPSALKQVEELGKKLNRADAELIKLSQDAIIASRNISSIQLPSQLTRSGADNARLLAELDRLKQKYEQLHSTIQRRSEQSRLSELRLQQQRERAFDQFERNSAREREELARSESAYNRIQNSVNLLTRTYNDLAIRKQLGGTLTAREERQLQSLTDRLNTYQTALRTVDSQIGRNQRNVGNYASGWNGLQNSINQLTREAPAFAVSMSTGFLAISNNLPMLFDEIQRVRLANEQLAASGQQTTSVLRQVATSVFSWGTALSVGVTLLTLFGSKLFDAIFNTDKQKKSLDALNRTQERYKDLLKDTNDNIDHNILLQKEQIKREQAITALRLVGKEITEENIRNEQNAQSELAKLDVKAAKDKLKNAEFIRDQNRIVYDEEVKQILTRKGLYEEGYKADVDAVKLQKKQILELEKQMTKDGLFIRHAGFIARNKEEQKRINDYNKLQIKWRNDQEKIDALTNSSLFNAKRKALNESEREVVKYGFALSEITAQTNTKLIEDETKANEELLKIREDHLKDLADLTIKELELELAKLEDIVGNEDLYYSDRITALEKDYVTRKKINESNYNEELRLSKDNNEKKRIAEISYQIENIKLLKEYSKKRADLEKLDLDEILDLGKILEDIDKLNKKEILKSLSDSGKRAQKELEEVGKKIQKAEAAMLKLQAATTSWIKSFTTDIFQNAGVNSIQSFFDDTFKNLLKGATTSEERFAVYFNSIAETAQETFNFLSQLTNKNFDSEKNRLEEQYNVALKYAGDNKEAQEKLNNDLEAQKKDIAVREAKAKKKQALMNIAIDTAQAIVGLWAKPGFPAAIPLAALVAGLGLAQAAIVSATEIPQYYMGGTHEGGKMMINDGAGSNWKETYVTPDGKIHQNENRNAIVDAPKGTKIYTHDQWLKHQQEASLRNMLEGKGISMNIPSVKYVGITEEGMMNVMSKTLAKQTIERSNLDAKGFSRYTIKQGNITRRNLNRANGKG